MKEEKNDAPPSRSRPRPQPRPRRRAEHDLRTETGQDMPPLGLSVDILGDGSLWAVWTPGHTPGHMSFLVNCIDGPLLLAMDAAFIHENLERKVAPSDYTWDVEKAQESLEKVIRFLDAYPQVRVGPGHEDLKFIV